MAETQGPRHIVWDWNGTLFADNHAVVAGVNAVCQAFDREHVDIEQWRALFSRPLLRCYERLLRRSLTEEDWERIEILYHDTYRELMPTCGLAHGVPDALQDWAASGRTQSLLSMFFHNELVPLVTDFGLHTVLDRIDGLRDDVGGGPKATHLEHHLAAQNLDPRDVVLIGDVVDDAHAAEHVGASCVLLTTGIMSRPALEPTGFPVVDSIPEAIDYLDTELAA